MAPDKLASAEPSRTAAAPAEHAALAHATDDARCGRSRAAATATRRDGRTSRDDRRLDPRGGRDPAARRRAAPSTASRPSHVLRWLGLGLYCPVPAGDV